MTKMMVSTTHKSPRWTLDDQEFALVEAGQFGDYRVSGDHANGYYAIAPDFGCGRTCTNPASAIRDLVYSNGCDSLTIMYE
jgi:hypothetical protein